VNNKSRWFPIFLGATALVMTGVAACGSAPIEPVPMEIQLTLEEKALTSSTPQEKTVVSSPALQIASYKLLQDNGSGAAGVEVKRFKPGDHVQYFDIQLTGFLKSGSMAKWVFTAVDTSVGKDIKLAEMENNVLPGNHLASRLSLDRDFLPGIYKVDIYIDQKLLGTIYYTVSQ
jgi:hypothetical protein